MKIVFSILVIVLLASCSASKTAKKTSPYPATSARKASATNTEAMPPGQAKKVYGHQSAKAFAPGQRKKSKRS